MDGQTEMRAKIMAINNDPNLTEAEKAVKRQELMCGKWSAPTETKGAPIRSCKWCKMISSSQQAIPAQQQPQAASPPAGASLTNPSSAPYAWTFATGL